MVKVELETWAGPYYSGPVVHGKDFSLHSKGKRKKKISVFLGKDKVA